MHRWIWDLRRTRPHAPRYGYPISAAPHATVRTPEGARVPPGTYTVKLIVDAHTFTTKVAVLPDPRIKLPAAVLARQNKLETQLWDLLDRVSAATLEAQSVVDQLAKLAPKDRTLAGQIAGAKAKVTMLLTGGTHEHGEPDVPALAGTAREVAELYGSVQVDAAPTAAQLAAARAYDREVTTLLASWKAFQTTELPQLQTALAAARLPAIDLKKEPTTEQSGGDEE
jgi:hypothetical protein